MQRRVGRLDLRYQFWLIANAGLADGVPTEHEAGPSAALLRLVVTPDAATVSPSVSGIAEWIEEG